MNLADFAHQILDNQQELTYLRAECKALKEHNAMLLRHIVDSNAASEQQLHDWVTGLLDGRLALTTSGGDK